jgi:hypothetical protein
MYLCMYVCIYLCMYLCMYVTSSTIWRLAVLGASAQRARSFGSHFMPGEFLIEVDSKQCMAKQLKAFKSSRVMYG